MGSPSATGLSLPVSGTVGAGPVRLLDADLEVPAVVGEDRLRQRDRHPRSRHGGSADRGHPRARHAEPTATLDERSRRRATASALPPPTAARPTLAPGQPHADRDECTTASAASRTATGALDAPELAQAYSFDPLYSSNDYGAGSHRRPRRDVRGGLPAERHHDLRRLLRDHAGEQPDHQGTVGGGGGTGAGTAEAELDIETVLSLAPKANIEVYEGGPPTASTTSSTRSSATTRPRS